MKRYFSLFFVILFGLNAYPAGFSVSSGNAFLYDTLNSPVAKGAIILCKENGGKITLKFSVGDSTAFQWYGYKNDPQDTVPLVNSITNPDGKSSTLDTWSLDSGYCVKYTVETNSIIDTITDCAWVAVYKPITSVTWDDDPPSCNDLLLKIQPSMKYILPTINGNKSTGPIQRNLTVTYFTFKEEDKKPGIGETTETHPSADTLLYLESIPYVDTEFIIKDRWAAKLGLKDEFISDTFYTQAVTAFPTTTVNNKEENELDPESWDKDDFGNAVFHFSTELSEDLANEFRTSAPLSVDLASNASPKTNHYIWCIARSMDFSDAFFIYEKEINGYLFKEKGFHYLKLIVRNKKGLSEEICVDSFFACINISESDLSVPNTFTPNGDGINDEFKVAYKSIESYRCRIYNQWGRKVYDSTDITKGWDGTIGSAKASIGAYFYVIEAKGTDGKQFKKQGDINLVRSK